MASYRLAVAISAADTDEFLLIRQSPPPPLPEEEYRRFVDSDLWDLPSATLRLASSDVVSDFSIDGAETAEIDLSRFDVWSAVRETVAQIGLSIDDFTGNWKLLKYIEEADFGPPPRINTVFVATSLNARCKDLPESSKWMAKDAALEMLSKARACENRIGPYMYIGVISNSPQLSAARVLRCQEYPPGMTIFPMKSRTLKPFGATNIVVVQAEKDAPDTKADEFVASADALLMDPGCCAEVHTKLAELVRSLPRKLVVFVTHHHHDHIEGLQVVQNCNPDAILLTHQNTMNYIGKGKWVQSSKMVIGGQKIRVGDHVLEIVYSPGHTDGHLGLLHVNTNALVVGDHCVGEGSAVLDMTAGGNMKDYFETTYKFINLSPHVVIPMHGRMNLWPKRMLTGYISHRRARESAILQAVKDGARTLFEIVKIVYAKVDKKLWYLASSNVCLHIDFLDHQKLLPEDFSMEKFRASKGVLFAGRFAWENLKGSSTWGLVGLILAGAATATAVVLRKNSRTSS